jgi:hypothetical protein
MNYCSDFKALSGKLSSKKAAVLDQQGIMATYCARHAAPFVALNLFSGEKYGYGDLMLSKIQDDFGNHRTINVFYDVACKYKSHAKVTCILFMH